MNPPLPPAAPDYSREPRSALEAIEAAQWIAFAPFIFQAARCLGELGVLAALDAGKPAGRSAEQLETDTQLSRYAIRVLLEAGLGLGMVLERDDRYHLAKTGWFWLHDSMTRANVGFTQDVNYQGLFHLDQALREGTPAGLKVFGEWPTIYRALAELPEGVRRSWFAFDHHYSDTAFAAALPKVFAIPPARLLDIGGNTGKWALAALRHDANVEMGIADLPGQLAMARTTLTEAGLSARVRFIETDLLDADAALPSGWDAIWMSQFLDCFGEAQIVSILRRCRAALAPGGRIWVLESFWDRQRFGSAALSLQMTSLYFTAMANGNSQMYRATLFASLLAQAGLKIVEQWDGLGVSNTLLACEPISA